MIGLFPRVLIRRRWPGGKRMGVENALGFLRSAADAQVPVYVIAGPQPFLREYVLEALRRRMMAAGYQYRAFQAGGAEGFGAVDTRARSGGSVRAAALRRLPRIEDVS